MRQRAPRLRGWWRAGIIAAVAVALALGAASQTGGERNAAPASLLDRLPRVAAGHYAEALAAARARGTRGRADVLWIELFYGDAAAQAQAEAALAAPSAGVAPAEAAETAFLQFLAAYIQGQDRQMLDAALRMMRAAPNDVATELAVRTLSGQLENQGRTLLDAVPSIEHVLREPLADPATSYMLGRSLLAAVHAPGLALTQQAAQQLAGRLPHWQLWGPFGDYENLDFDRTFPIETAAAASYQQDGATLHPQPFTSVGDGVAFPFDWAAQGVDFAVTYVHAPAPARVLVRLYSPASVKMTINGETVVLNDRRSSYRPATAVAAVELAAGWNRVVVKVAGEARRNFELMLRPEPGVELEDAATPPAGALAPAPRVLAPPITLAGWSAAHLAAHPDDAVALWVDGVRRTQDEDGENARVALEHAARLAPQAVPVWLALADADGELQDASQSWIAAAVEHAALQALKASPRAMRAHDRLGHVYQSEGKNTDAARQFTQCSGRGYGDCDWSAFRLDASQRWLPEAESALEHALAESGSDWSSIAAGLEFYSSIGNAAQSARWERVLAADPRAAAAYGAYQLRHGDATKAAALFQTAIAQDPSAPGPREQLLDALLLSGNLPQAQSAAQQALADFPHDWRVAAAADQIALAQGAKSGIAALRQTDFRRNVLRHQADYLAGDKFWAPWYHSAAELIKDAPGKEAYPSAHSVLVFDQLVNRINPDSTQDQYIHQIYRVLDAAGIEQLGDVTTIPRGSDIITVRTIKQDGRMLLPEHMGNITDITMPGLEPGDYIELEFIQHMPASNLLPGQLDNSEFFIFNSSTQPYHYSNYIVLTPPGYPLMVDQERFPNTPTVTKLPDGYTAHSWLVQKTRILVTEPHMPPEQNLVPKVWVSSESTWAEISRYYADHMFAVRKVTPEMRQEAQKLAAGHDGDIARADAIFDWVAANIQPGDGSPLAPARQTFTDRSGNRVAMFLALLSAAKVPYKLVQARAVTDDSSTKIPSLFQFQYTLVHVGDAGPDSLAGWYDLNNDFAHTGYVVPGVRGGLALAASPQSDGSFTHVPAVDSPLDGVVVTVTGTVAGSGDATIHLAMEFRGPDGEQVRTALANQPDSNLPQIYQQLLIANYPNGVSSGGKIENRSDKTKPLIVDVDATVPNFVRSDSLTPGAGWDIARLSGSVGVLARYAQLPFRTEPLVIGGDSFEQTKVTLDLPAKFGSAALPADANLQTDYGRLESTFKQTTTAAGGHRISFNRVFTLRANLVQPQAYPAFRRFAEAVDSQDRLEITGKLQ